MDPELICDFSADGVCRRCGFVVTILPNFRNCVPIEVLEKQGSSPGADFESPRSVVKSEPDAVPWLQKAKNFAAATAQHVAAGMPTCSDAEIARRHDICLGCEHFKDNTCTQCGCPVKRDRQFISKLAWADQSCPVGKWGPVEG